MNKKIMRAACYVRVSTENQLENYSIEEQIERLKAYCLAKDWNIYRIYTDGGYSGGNTERPALKQLLNDIHNNKLDIVIVYKLDRLSRSQKDTLTLIEDEFLNNNVDFVSMSENFDTSTPFGRAMIGILSVFAQLEKDQITERFTMGRIGRGKAGYYHGGSTAPTGYNYTDGKLVIDEYKSLQVREVFDLFLSGHSINSIQRQMHNKYGGWNSHSLIINILRNSVYIGKVKFKKQIYDGIHDPIIQTDVFFKAQQLLKSADREEQKTSAQKTPYRANYLLSSLIYCDKCGARYSANHGCYKCYSRSKSDRKYVKDPNCKGKNWEIEKLDAIILNEIEKLKQDGSFLNEIFNLKQENSPVDADSIKERIKAIDIQIPKMIDLYQIKDISIDEISLRISELQKEKDFLNQSLILAEEDKGIVKQKLIILLDETDSILTAGSLEEKRLFVSSVIKSILVNDEQIHINWRI